MMFVQNGNRAKRKRDDNMFSDPSITVVNNFVYTVIQDLFSTYMK